MSLSNFFKKLESLASMCKKDGKSGLKFSSIEGLGMLCEKVILEKGSLSLGAISGGNIGLCGVCWRVLLSPCRYSGLDSRGDKYWGGSATNEGGLPWIELALFCMGVAINEKPLIIEGWPCIMSLLENSKSLSLML